MWVTNLRKNQHKGNDVKIRSASVLLVPAAAVLLEGMKTPFFQTRSLIGLIYTIQIFFIDTEPCCDHNQSVFIVLWTEEKTKKKKNLFFNFTPILTFCGNIG